MISNNGAEGEEDTLHETVASLEFDGLVSRIKLGRDVALVVWVVVVIQCVILKAFYPLAPELSLF